jgi:biotin carboxyl carrier protein
MSAADSANLGPWNRLGGFRVTRSAGHVGWVALDVTTPEGVTPVEIAGDGKVYRLQQASTITELEIAITGNRLSVVRRGLGSTCYAAVHNEIVSLSQDGMARDFGIAPRIEHAGANSSAEIGGAGRIAAPMPGLISKLNVVAGQQVAQGDSVIVLEAMKLMYNLPAQVSGRVTEIFCTAGDTVAAGASLLDIEADG